MCHGYRIDEREALRAFEDESEEDTPEGITETETEMEESEREPPLPTADD